LSGLGITLLALSGLTFLVFVLLATRSSGEREDPIAKRRLRSLRDRLSDPASGRDELSILKEAPEAGDTASRWNPYRPPRQFLEWLELLLYRAGASMGALRLLLVCASVCCVFAALGLKLFVQWETAIALGLAGLAIPIAIVQFRARRMMKRFESDFPEALGLVARCLRGGHALQRSLRIIADEMRAPLSVEFALAADELSLGRDIGSVLDALARRTGIPDVALFASGIMVQREFGGNLAEVVDNLAAMIRDRFKFHARVRAMTSMNRSSALILLVIPMAFVGLMSFTNRDFVSPLWETSQGHTLSFITAGLSLGGYVLARKIGNVGG
jgi:tight adherence protein B